jgi:hypothetical protein
LTCKETLWQVFTRRYSQYLRPSFVTYCPSNLLSGSTLPLSLPVVTKYTVLVHTQVYRVHSHAPSIRSHRGHKWVDQGNESPRRTGLHLPLSAKSSFYLPVFDISRSCPCRTASVWKGGGGLWCFGPQTYKHLTQSPFTWQSF